MIIIVVLEPGSVTSKRFDHNRERKKEIERESLKKITIVIVIVSGTLL